MLWSGYCFLYFVSFVSRHLVIATSRNCPFFVLSGTALSTKIVNSSIVEVTKRSSVVIFANSVNW